MKTVTVFGSSDDLIEFSGCEGCDEFYSTARFNSHYCGMWRLDSEVEDCSVEIHAIYNGSWSFAVSTDDGEDHDKFPNWAISRTWGTDSAYSETLQIIVPDDTELTRII